MDVVDNDIRALFSCEWWVGCNRALGNRTKMTLWIKRRGKNESYFFAGRGGERRLCKL